MSGFHEAFGWVVIVLNGLVGLWAVAAHRFESARHRSMWWSAHVAHASVAIQASVGAYLVSVEDIEPDQFHMFYGFLTLGGVALIVGYRQLSEYRYLIYGLGGLFIMGLAIRAMTLNGSL